jgi:deazaflavin-dependent oxidoreductase (nitroreductase family)
VWRFAIEIWYDPMMMKRLVTTLGLLVLAVSTLGLIFVLGMRAKYPPVLGAVRRMNRTVFNPSQMRSAGSPGAFAAIIGHVGRRSGNQYETPVGAVPTADGFVIALPYGAEADWLKNVLASGSATIVHEGATFDVDSPLVIPIDESGVSFSSADERSHRLFGVAAALQVRRVDPTTD